MIQAEKCKWSFQFNSVDRSELFGAIRGLTNRMRDELIQNAEPVDETDPYTINTSVEVHSLNELKDVMDATANVKGYWGNGLHIYVRSSQLHICGSLIEAQKQFLPSSCTISAPMPKEGRLAGLTKKMEELRKTLKEMADEISQMQGGEA